MLADKTKGMASSTARAEALDERGSNEERRASCGLIGVIVFSVLGLANMIYLTRLHWVVSSVPGYQSFCNISAEYDCDAVAASEYSLLFGVPVSFWGVLAYIVIGGLAVWGLRIQGSAAAPRGAGLGLLSGLAVGSLLTSAALSYISHAFIESFCVMCMLGYVINMGIAISVAWALFKHRIGPVRALWNDLSFLLERPKLSTSLGCGGLAVAVGTLLVYPTPSMQEEPGLGKVAGDGTNPAIWEEAPYKGPSDAEVTIVEFTDYECPACRASHQRLEGMLAPYEGRYRIMHRHFPLDQACNPSIPREFNKHACQAARYAICASQQDKFWEMNSLLFRSRRPLEEDHLRALAEHAGCDMEKMDECLASGLPDDLLARDVEDGIELEVRGTPTLFINGHRIVGLPRPEALEAIFGSPDDAS